MKKAKGKSVKSHLPKRAPKKTGKSGIGPKDEPLDPVKDFDTPTRKEPETTEAQGSLLPTPPKPQKPTVVGQRFEVFYDKPIFGKHKDVVTVALQCTTALEKDHVPLLPKLIRDAYHDVTKKGRKSSALKDADVPGQHAVFFLSSDIDDSLLVLPAAKLSKNILSEVQRKGEGVSRTVIRWAFRLQVKLSREVAHFAENNLQNSLWLSVKDTQESLFDAKED